MARPASLKNHPLYASYTRRYAFDLPRFAVEVCASSPTYQQVEIYESTQYAGSRTSVSSGHGTGKTFAFAVTALWHLTCYPNSNTFFSAPKIDTLRQGIWKEFATLKEKIKKGRNRWIADFIVVEAERVFIAGHKMNWFCAARTAPRGSPEALAGTHGDWLLWLIDEASGVPDENFGVIGGSLTDAKNRMVLASQPTRPSGFFYDTHNSLSKRNGGVWNAITLNSEKSPLVSESFLQEKLLQYGGRESEEYQIKVMGRFPTNRDGYLLGRQQSENCIGKTVISDEEPYGLFLLVDVGAGEYRDKSVAIVSKVTGSGEYGADARRMQVIDVPIYSNTRNLQDFTGDLVQIASKYENITIAVDAGGMGVSVCQALEGIFGEIVRVKWGSPCFINTNRERYVNKRSQAIVAASRAVKEGRLGLSRGAYNKDLLDQMSRVPYHYDEKARYQVEKKEKMREMGIPSPDLWDAICFGFMEGMSYNLFEGSVKREKLSAADDVLTSADSYFADF